MCDYVTLSQVKAQGFSLHATLNDAVLTALLPAASRVIDRLCVLPDDYFCVGSETPSAKVFCGDELQFLWIPPHKETIIAGNIAIEDGLTVPPFTDKGKLLQAKKGECWPDADITITTKWGFAAIPAEITQAALEMVLQQFRTTDGANERAVSDLAGQPLDERRISPRIKEVCEMWKRRTRYIVS